MCTRVTCRTCGKPTYSGCGMHVEQVLGDVPRLKRCRCAEEKAAAKRAAKAAAGPSWLERLLGK
jgi:hypothetical protein